MAAIHFLGTNGWYDTYTGNTLSVLVETKDRYIILDAGFGIYKIGKYIRDEKPISIFISHLHLDHLIGLHTLSMFKFPQGIDLVVPPDSAEDIKTLMKRPFTRPLDDMPTQVRLHELGKTAPAGIEFGARELLHAVRCYGFRFRLDGRTIAFCTDTEDCGGLRELAKDADILMTECALKSGQESKGSFHLTPEAAAIAAKESGVKKLALIHFDPGRYPELKDRRKAQKAARKIFKSTFAVNDDETIKV